MITDFQIGVCNIMNDCNILLAAYNLILSYTPPFQSFLLTVSNPPDVLRLPE